MDALPFLARGWAASWPKGCAYQKNGNKTNSSGKHGTLQHSLLLKTWAKVKENEKKIDISSYFPHFFAFTHPLHSIYSQSSRCMRPMEVGEDDPFQDSHIHNMSQAGMRVCEHIPHAHGKQRKVCKTRRCNETVMTHAYAKGMVAIFSRIVSCHFPWDHQHIFEKHV